jgi:hypothetical protein
MLTESSFLPRSARREIAEREAAQQKTKPMKLPNGFFFATAEESGARSAEMLATFDDLCAMARGLPGRNQTAEPTIAEQQQGSLNAPHTAEVDAASAANGMDALEDTTNMAGGPLDRNRTIEMDISEQERTFPEDAHGLTVNAPAINPPHSVSQAGAEFAQIRAFVMNIHNLLQGTNAAHLVAVPIEHIHRSLDRIEQSVERAIDRRRPGRVEYIGSDLVSMLRDPGRIGTGAGDDQSDVGAESPSASPLSQTEPDMASVVSGLIPRDADATFVAGMEDVLEVYQRPHDPAYPVVCVDEASKQLLGETRVPIATNPGQPTQLDYEYERHGTANLFMMFAPLEGWRHVKVTDQRGALDYAQVLKDLSDTHFPDAKKIILVQDDLSTHKPASLYEAFPAAEARRLVERFEWHNAPKDGSWLDMAKSELGALSSQCLDRRMPDKQTLVEEVAAWKESRNKTHAKAGWQFTTAEARITLKRLYPQGDRVKSLA